MQPKQTLQSLYTIQFSKYSKIAYMLFFVFAFWGPALGGIPFASVSMFPARIFALLTWVGMLFWFSTSYRQLDFKTVIHKNWRQIFLATWLIWGVISLLWAMDTGQGIRDLFNLFIGLSLVGLAPFFLKDKIQIDRAARIWITTFAIFMVVALVEHLTTIHLPISRFSHGLQPHLNYRPTAVFVNENNFAVFMSLSFPFLLSRWRYFTDLGTRFAMGLGLFGGIYMLFVTGSRINYIVLVVTVLLYSGLLTPRGKKLKVLAALMVLVVGTWMFFGISQPHVRGYASRQFSKIIYSYQELLNPQGGDYLVSNNSIGIRINMIRNGAYFLRKTWGMGVGAGNFETWVEEKGIYETLTGEDQLIANPHNWWIELPAEYGIFISLGYLAFLASLLWAAWFSWKRTQAKEKWIPEALTLTLLILPLLAISPNSFLDFMPHWLILTLAFAWQQYSQGQEG